MQYTVRHPLGNTRMVDGDGLVTERDTVMCVHCQMHWQVQPGSGRERGFCLRCMGPTCGKEVCEAGCTPWERLIEAMEGSRVARAKIDDAIAHAWRL